MADTPSKLIPRPRRALQKSSRPAWLSVFNPLHGLTVARAQALFDLARRGNDTRLQWTYANMEAADPTLLVCTERRAGALIDLDWTVRPKASARASGFDRGLADEQAAFLEGVYGAAEEKNLFGAIERLASAFFRGHAHAAPLYTYDGLSLKGFELHDSWNFCRNPLTGSWHWNPDCLDTADFDQLEEIPEGEIVTLRRERAIDYPAMAIYLRAALGEKAWGQFLERYGVPPVIITMPEIADPNKVEEYCRAAAEVADGGSGALPFGSQVSYATEARGTNPFVEFAAHQQQLVVLMATGGQLTMLTGATGIGQGATDAHEDAWRSIVRRDAGFVATALNRTVTDTLLDRAFPGRPHLAQFDFETETQPSPAEVFELAAKARAGGYRIAKEELEERTGYTLEEETAPDAPAQGGGLPFFNRAPAAGEAEQPVRKEIAALAKALQLDLTPAAEAVQNFLKNPTPEAAVLLQSKLPELLPEDPQSALLMEQALAEMTVEAQRGKTVENRKSSFDPNQPRDEKGQFDDIPGAKGEADSKKEKSGKEEKPSDNDSGKQSGNKPKGKKKPKGGKKFPMVKDLVHDDLPEDPGKYQNKDGSYDVPKFKEANFKRGTAALTRALESGEDVPNAMRSKALGLINFEQGRPGNPNREYEGGYGLTHAIKKHGEHIVRKIPEILSYGKYYEDTGGDGVVVVKNNILVSLKKQFGRYVVVTIYESKKKAAFYTEKGRLIENRGKDDARLF